MMKWGSAFRVVAHELRSPAGVIGGYARMLMSGRLDETGREAARRQLARAAGRLGDLAQQSSDLAGWLEPHPEEIHHLLPIGSIIERAALGAAAPDLVRVLSEPTASDLCVRTREPRALSAAFSSVIDATSREMERRRSEVGIAARHSDRPGWCDVIVGPPAVIDGIRMDITPGEDSRFNLEGGGLGLHMIVGAVVLDAHGASLWASRDARGITGVRIPVGTGN
jgi:signal transduction histidine kinase